MEDSIWKLGDPCFIVDLSVGDFHARAEILPALVTHVGGVASQTVTATSLSTARFGRRLIEGRPHQSEQDARDWLAAYVKRVVDAVTGAQVTGRRPTWQVAAPVSNGDIVYGIDPVKREVFEAVIGYLRYEYGRIAIGYDPGPEASMVAITEWWPDKESALRAAIERHSPPFSFLSKEELARRSQAEIQAIFDGAVEFMKGDEFQKSLKSIALITNKR